MSDKKPEVGYYRGRNLKDMTKDELIDCIKELDEVLVNRPSRPSKNKNN